MFDPYAELKQLAEAFDPGPPAVGGGTLQVVSRDGLVVLKTSAGRPQDLVDISG